MERQDDQAPTKLDMFRARAEARAMLYAACEFDLQDAVDVLQTAAEQSGLLAELGQDGVQLIITTAFEDKRDDLDAVQADAPDAPERVAASVFMTAGFLWREGDVERFRAWLATRTEAERRALHARYSRRRR